MPYGLEGCRIRPGNKNDDFNQIEDKIFNKLSKIIYNAEDGVQAEDEEGNKAVGYTFHGVTSTTCEDEKSLECIDSAKNFADKQISFIYAKKNNISFPVECLAQDQYSQKLFQIPKYYAFKPVTTDEGGETAAPQTTLGTAVLDSNGDVIYKIVGGKYTTDIVTATLPSSRINNLIASPNAALPYVYIANDLNIYKWDPTVIPHSYINENDEEVFPSGYSSEDDPGAFVKVANYDRIKTLINNDLISLAESRPYKKVGTSSCHLLECLKNALSDDNVTVDRTYWESKFKLNTIECSGSYCTLYELGKKCDKGYDADKCSQCSNNVYITFSQDTLNETELGKINCRGCNGESDSLNCPFNIMYAVNLNNPGYINIKDV